MNLPSQKLNLRDLLIQRHVFEQKQTQTSTQTESSAALPLPRPPAGPGLIPSQDLRTDFEKNLHQLNREYEVEVLMAGPTASGETLAGRPLQLHLSPRQKNGAGATFQIRVSGVAVYAPDHPRNLVFKPVSVDLSRLARTTSSNEFQEEADSAVDIVAHVYRVLKLLHHPEHFTIALTA